jgi:hypothetical protein
MNINELKVVIAEVLEEAKSKLNKEDKKKLNAVMASGLGKMAYGTYAEAFDFSHPLGDDNLYKQQGGVNWGPYTSVGPTVAQNFANPNIRIAIHESNEESAIRRVIREVIANGLTPSNSAWAPVMESKNTFDNHWEAALNECAWYMQHMETNGVPSGGPKKGTNIEKKAVNKNRQTSYGTVKAQGPEKDDQGGKNKRVK